MKRKVPTTSGGGEKCQRRREATSRTALATDVFKNVERGQVLSLAVGRLLDIFVRVPDRVGDKRSLAAAHHAGLHQQIQ